MVKCGDYFQAEDGPREFGNISIISKWTKTTETSLVLRHLEVKHKEVKFLLMQIDTSTLFSPDYVSLFTDWLE